MKWPLLVLPVMMLALPAKDAAADTVAPVVTPSLPIFDSIINKLHPQHGRIMLGGGLATLNLPPDLAYLPPDQTYLLQRRITGTPANPATLGGIVPTNVPVGSRLSWLAVITYFKDAPITDDLSRINADAMLMKLKQENDARNVTLKRLGYDDISTEIIGWAVPPRVDKAARTLAWALEIQPYGKPDRLLNYNMYLKGQHSTITLSVLGMSRQMPLFEQLPVIDKDAKEMLAAIRFTSPARAAAPPHSDNGKYLLSAILLTGVLILFKLKKRRPAA